MSEQEEKREENNMGIIGEIAARESGLTESIKGYSEPGTEIIQAAFSDDWNEVMAILACPDPD